MNYLQQLQADIDRLQQQCKPQLMTVRYTKLPSTIMTDKTKMIYNDDNTIGVDADSLNKLMDILTPRMQEQLVNELIHNHEVNQ